MAPQEPLRWVSRVLRAVLQPVGEALAIYGGGDVYLRERELDSRRLDARYALFRSAASDGPPPGHPERLCPEQPFSVQEVLLMRELEHLDWRGR